MSDVIEVKDDVEVETVVETVEETEVETEATNDKKTEEKGYVALRVERAEKQTQKNILNELGVNDLATAKEKLEQGQEALNRIEALEKQLAEKDKRIETKAKEDAVIKLLESEKVFDAEALMLYVDIDTVELSEDGSLKDGSQLVDLLKTRKPNYFGTFSKESDVHKQGGTTQVNTAIEKQKAGDSVGAIAQDITNQLKR